jgi:hypothetical protein
MTIQNKAPLPDQESQQGNYPHPSDEKRGFMGALRMILCPFAYIRHVSHLRLVSKNFVVGEIKRNQN